MEPINLNTTKTWSSIDIFIFSNGQRYSPPRKYHLRSEELQRWSTTVGHLARTQYGSGHSSIDLYTIDGTKINGPLELINGATYVAVELPGSFIEAGYKKYLLKATRSREKRLSQQSNRTEMSNPENKDLKINADANTADENSIPEENVIGKPTIVANDTKTSPLKGRPTKTQQLSQRKSVITGRQIQKKKSSHTYNTALKKNYADADKIYLCPRKMSYRNEVPNNKGPSIIPCKKNKNQQQLICSNKLNPTKAEEHSESDGVQSISKPSKIVESPLTSYNDVKNITIESERKLTINSTVSVKELPVVSLHTNLENSFIPLKIPSQNDRIYNSSVYRLERNNIPEEVFSVQNEKIQNTTPNTNQAIDNLSLGKFKSYNKNEEERDAKTNIPVVDDGWEDKLNNKDTNANNSTNFPENQVTDEYIAYMNKGGILLLKFNIKVKDCKTIFNKDKSKNIEQSPSYINLHKTEKTSQVDIDINFSGELLKASGERINQDKSLQSILNKLYSEDRDPRLIILQCACPDYSNIERDNKYHTIFCGCDSEEESKYTAHQRNLNGKVASCDCYNEVYGASREDPQNRVTYMTSVTPDSSLIETNGIRVKYLAQKFESSDKTLWNKTVGNDIVNKGRLPRSDSVKYVLTKLYDLSEASTEHIVGEGDNIDSAVISTCDKFTQTDWSNILLEARLEEGDKYTFHLPPLCILKNYSQ